MFQTFDAATNPQDGPPRLGNLRHWMADQKLDGFLVPRTDQFQGEYVAACDERLSWLTGFTGSAGFACVLADIAGVFIDGRYRIQVLEQVADCYTPVPWPETALPDWLKQHIHSNARIGFDPWLHTISEIEKYRGALQGSEIELVAVKNGVDDIWTDRPAQPMSPAFAHPIRYSGENSRDKIARIAAAIAKADCDAFLLTQPDSVNWLLNIRGGDIPKTPIVQAFAVVHASGRVTLISDPDKFQSLGPDPLIDILGWDECDAYCQSFDAVMGIDPKSTPMALHALLPQTKHADDPCALAKACKNQTEIEGARQAHIRDAAAYCEFLAWFAAHDTSKLTEIDVVKKLEGFRTATGQLHDISFDSICGSGPNGAIVHYRVTDETNRALDHNSLLLIDSGAQYPDGTTDITRVLPLGTPTNDMKDRYTRVLKGMIAVSSLRFPNGLAGRDIDALARAPLWSAGLDYDHGTGHGVGSFLSVHEGPQRISRVSNVPLQPGMIVSNEPGYYKENAYGIRIENLIVVQNADQIPGADDRDHLDFETLTLVPIDTSLITTDLMTNADRDWLNAYHKRVFETISPLLSDAARDYIKIATQPI